MTRSKAFQRWPLLQLAIGRLIRVRRLLDDADRAIDLGIALEVALNPPAAGKKDAGGNTELRHKIAARGAWLIGSGLDGRRTTFDLLQKAYDARSAAAHQGELRDEKSLGAIEAAEPVCAAILFKLLESGRFPDWKELVLGGLF